MTDIITNAPESNRADKAINSESASDAIGDRIMTTHPAKSILHTPGSWGIAILRDLSDQPDQPGNQLTRQIFHIFPVILRPRVQAR